ncbi:MAG: toll/interleukin-1 receptor domain-containing protein [Leptolyngbya sp. SIO1D8]|nr:toll/interleukin-1 receptor domain-containing protein [Leptolyngbya sp. SIO1D8]
MNQSGTIFISYRRSDSQAEAGRIYDNLVPVFGPDRLFKDVDNIPYGVDFVEYLDQAVAQCDVVIALVGHTWLTVTDAQGKRRLDDPRDFVRIEVASALKRDILVVPVLLNGASMPAPETLPEELRSLTRRNAVQVRQDPDFHRDLQRVITNLKEYFASRGITVGDPKQIAVQPKAEPSKAESEANSTAHSTSSPPRRSGRYLAAGVALILLIGAAIGGLQIFFRSETDPAQPSQTSPPEDSPPPHPDGTPPPHPDGTPPPHSDGTPPPQPDDTPPPRPESSSDSSQPQSDESEQPQEPD